jgi:gamma-glutamylcyclotransferase (GGCT)/AIG2-like uncharacterized protein YtfP
MSSESIPRQPERQTVASTDFNAISVHSIFVYGTLRRGQCRENQWPCPARSIVRAFVSAKLYDLGPYPAIVEGQDAVAGERWDMAPEDLEKTFFVLDQIEGFVEGRTGNLYERKIIETHSSAQRCDEKPALAFAYFMHQESLPKKAIYLPAERLVGDGLTGYAQWPRNDQDPSVTSVLPDPFE